MPTVQRCKTVEKQIFQNEAGIIRLLWILLCWSLEYRIIIV